MNFVHVLLNVHVCTIVSLVPLPSICNAVPTHKQEGLDSMVADIQPGGARCIWM